MKIPFLILIGSVFIVSIVFGILIWRQSVKFEKKALVAKQRKEQFIREMEEAQKKEEINLEQLAVEEELIEPIKE